MSFAKSYSAQVTGLGASIVTVEVDLARGLHAFTIVGLPDKAVEEARDRFAAALKNSGFTSPKEKNQKVVVSLAPADLKKTGPNFDLAIALTYLQAAEDIAFDPEGSLYIGELALDGALRPVAGVLPLVRHAQQSGYARVFVPEANAREAALIADIEVYGAATLRDVTDHLAGETLLSQTPPTTITYTTPQHAIDFADVRGQESAKRGLEIAAAGGHNIALYGPPGTGKTMLARAFTGLLPQLSFDEVLEVTSVHSVAGKLTGELITHPPFRSPHHTASYVSLIGGGTTPAPGEVTLAHRGVLFLDEFPEFDRRVIESLRQPLQDGVIHVSRARGSATFPAEIILVAAMNPCPCGHFGSEAGKVCTCSPSALERYTKKLSGPIIDRIDMWLEVAAVDLATLRGERDPHAETSATIAARVSAARGLQHRRLGAGKTNSMMSVREIDAHIPLSPVVEEVLHEAATRLGLSARSYHKVIKLARTIADIANEDEIGEVHVLEALSYRPKEQVI